MIRRICTGRRVCGPRLGCFERCGRARYAPVTGGGRSMDGRASLPGHRRWSRPTAPRDATGVEPVPCSGSRQPRRQNTSDARRLKNPAHRVYGNGPSSTCRSRLVCSTRSAASFIHVRLVVPRFVEGTQRGTITVTACRKTNCAFPGCASRRSVSLLGRVRITPRRKS